MHSPRIDLLIQPQVRLRLESISKTEVLEEQADRGHLNERQKVLRMILPADQKPVLPLHPTEEPLHDPLPLRPPKTTIRPAFEIAFDCAGAARSSPRPAPAMRRPKDRCRTPCLQSGSQARPPTNAKSNDSCTSVASCGFAGCVFNDSGSPQRSTIRHDLHSRARLGLSHACSASLRPRERRVHVRLRAVEETALLRFACQIFQHSLEHAGPDPGLKPPRHRLVVRIALRKKAPLRPRCAEPTVSPQRPKPTPEDTLAALAASSLRENGGEPAPHCSSLNFTSIMLHDTQSSDPKQPHHVFEISSSKMSIPGSSATYRFGPPR